MATDPLAQARQAGYEHRDVSTLGLCIFFAATAGFLVGMSFGLKWLFGHYARTATPAPVIEQPFTAVRPLPPPPVLQPSPGNDIEEYRRSQQSILESYGWIDRHNGIVRIPIDRAMTLTVTKVLPVRNSEEEPSPAASRGSNATSGDNTSTKEVQP